MGVFLFTRVLLLHLTDQQQRTIVHSYFDIHRLLAKCVATTSSLNTYNFKLPLPPAWLQASLLSQAMINELKNTVFVWYSDKPQIIMLCLT